MAMASIAMAMFTRGYITTIHHESLWITMIHQYQVLTIKSLAIEGSCFKKTHEFRGFTPCRSPQPGNPGTGACQHFKRMEPFPASSMPSRSPVASKYSSPLGGSSGYPLVNMAIAMEAMAIYSGFSHRKWWFVIPMLNYQRVYPQL